MAVSAKRSGLAAIAVSVLPDGIQLEFAMFIAMPTPPAVARVCAPILVPAFAKQAELERAARAVHRTTIPLVSVPDDAREAIVFKGAATKRASAIAA